MPPTDPAPPLEGRPPPAWVDESSALEALAERVSRAEVVGLDVEANGLHAWRERVCVVQLCVEGATALVDPLALGDLGPLRAALDAPRPEVVLHGGDFDVSLLARDHAFRFRQVFDTMVAATLLGEPKVGLADLVEQAFGVRLDKRFQTCDWTRRPLEPEQRAYLQADVVFLQALRDRLHARLAAADLLEEAAIEMAWLAGRRAEPPRFDPQGWRRLKGADRLDDAGRALLDALWTWREAEAERRDRPAFRVLAPASMLALAARPPLGARRPDELTALHPGERRRVGPAVLAALRRAEETLRQGRSPPPTAAPPRTPADQERQRRARRVEDALRAWRRTEAGARGVPNLVVFPNRALAWLVREAPADRAALEACADLGQRRVERYGEAILRVLRQAGA